MMIKDYKHLIELQHIQMERMHLKCVKAKILKVCKAKAIISKKCESEIYVKEKEKCEMFLKYVKAKCECEIRKYVKVKKC